MKAATIQNAETIHSEHSGKFEIFNGTFDFLDFSDDKDNSIETENSPLVSTSDKHRTLPTPSIFQGNRWVRESIVKRDYTIILVGFDKRLMGNYRYRGIIMTSLVYRLIV